MQVKFYYEDKVKPLNYQSSGSSGMDLAANETTRIPPQQTSIVSTGVN